MSIPFQVVELSAASGPEQDTHGHESEYKHAGNEAVDDFHWFSFREKSSPREESQRYGLCDLVTDWIGWNRARMRAEFPITASELRGMDTAATNGVMKAAIAKGTITTL